MKKRIGILLTLLVCLTAGAALAAEVFAFEERTATVFVGESWKPALIREGAAAGEGEITWASADLEVLSVDAEGNVRGLKKGRTRLTATLKIGKRSLKAQCTVQVTRRVTKVSLATQNLNMVSPDDPAVAGLLSSDTGEPVLMLPTGRSVRLNGVCTPEDAADRAVLYEISDAAVARVTNNDLRGLQPGECDLTLTSRQNPEVTEVVHVLVTQPVQKLTIQGGNRTVNVGETLQLGAEFQPENSSIRQVEWSSRTPANASVDGNGLVTGLKKGTATIQAKAKDGSGITAVISLTVARKADAVSLKETEATVATGRRISLTAQVLPADANDRNVTWTSSDEGIATVNRGQVTGVKAGDCVITCVSNSNPEASAQAVVHVIQPVTKIELSMAEGATFHVGTDRQITASVLPEDATVKKVTYRSSSPKIASVDENGLVHGLSRGMATITATAEDGSRKQGSIRVTVTQPVEGVSIQYGLYHVQLNRSLGVRALLEPKNANDTRMTWSVDDPYVAAVRGSKNVGTVHGLHEGETTVTGVTTDGGFSASAQIRVADFNGAVRVEDLYVKDNKIRILLKNRSSFIIEKVYFRIDCYDRMGNPMVCHDDGVSTSFEGDYPLELYPGEESVHGKFNFPHVKYDQELGAVVIHITGWRDAEGYTRNIKEEEDQPTAEWPKVEPIVL